MRGRPPKRCINGCADRISRDWRLCVGCARAVRDHALEQLLNPWMRDGAAGERDELVRRRAQYLQNVRRAARRAMLERGGFHLVAAA